jgi:hypothetical protein
VGAFNVTVSNPANGSLAASSASATINVSDPNGTGANGYSNYINQQLGTNPNGPTQADNGNTQLKISKPQ